MRVRKNKEKISYEPGNRFLRLSRGGNVRKLDGFLRLDYKLIMSDPYILT